MSGDFRLEDPIPVSIFKDVIVQAGGAIDDKQNPSLHCPHFMIHKDKNFAYIFTNEALTFVEEFGRYGINDTTWFREIMIHEFDIDIGDL